MEHKIYTPHLDTETEEIIKYAVKNPETPRHLREIACNLSVHFDNECLEAWMHDHAEEWHQIVSYAEAAGYGDIDLEEASKFC